MEEYKVISSGHFHSDDCFGETTRREWRELTFWTEQQFNELTGACWDSLTGDVSASGDSISEELLEHYKRLSYDCVKSYRVPILLEGCNADSDDWGWLCSGLDDQGETIFGFPALISEQLVGDPVGINGDSIKDLINYRGWQIWKEYGCQPEFNKAVMGSTLDKRAFLIYKVENQCYIQFLKEV